jgi:hypothetical protein
MDLSAFSADDKVAHMAISTMSAERNITPWRILRGGGGFKGPGELAVAMDRVEIQATPDVISRRRIGALGFNLSCMRLMRHCSPCQLLPFACQAYEHGDWYYFELSDDLLKNFRTVVNDLPLGISEEMVVNRVGWGGLTSQELFDDKLPYRFPDGTMLEDSDPKHLVYYAKKWREEQDTDSRDRTITLTFDKNDRLIRVNSQVDGIHSRP